MSPSPDRAAIRNAEGNIQIADAARAVIAERGLSGMSLRTVAEKAGMSVGSISYRIGDRAALVVAVIERETALLDEARAAWCARLAGVDAVATGILPDLVGEWLDLGVGARRTSAAVICEIALTGSRDPHAMPGLGDLLDAGEGLWRDLLAATPDGERLARLISSYCLDEQPFSILLSDQVDYRLLRHSTIRALLRLGEIAGDAPSAASLWHMALVDRLAIPAAAALDRAEELPEGVKASIAEHIADILVTQGVGGLSHRVVAQAADMAASSVAHHYPTHRDILFGGVEAIYRRLRADLRASTAEAPSGDDIIRLTHECALAALIDPAFLPFAIDMRRRRAENVHEQVAGWIGIPPDSDRAQVQAIVMALIGRGLRALATGRPSAIPDQLDDFLKIRTDVL